MFSMFQVGCHDAASCQRFRQGRPRPLDVGLHFRKRQVQMARNLLVRHVFEVKEHQRQTLVLRKSPKGFLDQHAAAVGVDTRCSCVSDRELRQKLILARILSAQLGEEPPAPAIAREMVERETGGHRFQPTTGRRAVAQVCEILVRPEKDFLRDVLGVVVVPADPGGGGEDHILIGVHKGREFG